MKKEYDNFIGIFTDVYDEGFCQHLISEFERNKTLGAGTNRQDGEGAQKTIKDDYHIFFNGKNLQFEDFLGFRTIDFFYAGLQKCFDNYAREYPGLESEDINCRTMKMQKTSSGGGYHVWHSEQGNGDHANRGLVYSLYLNTLEPENFGETEFLYQQKRIRPVENTLVIWPAAFTHTHRGNPVYGDKSKYIVTGWFYYE